MRQVDDDAGMCWIRALNELVTFTVPVTQTLLWNTAGEVEREGKATRWLVLRSLQDLDAETDEDGLWHSTSGPFLGKLEPPLLHRAGDTMMLMAYR